MRWIQSLSALILCLLGIAWAFPGRTRDAAGAVLILIDRLTGGVAFHLWLDNHADVIGNAAPFVLIGLSIVLLIAANIRARVRRDGVGLDIVFDARAPKYVEHDVWHDPENNPMPGMAYRVGIRNKTGSTLHDVIVLIVVEDAKATPARFFKDKSYEAEIGPRATELVELFMMRDQDIADHVRIVKTVKVRATAAGARETARTFKFDNQAAAPLSPV